MDTIKVKISKDYTQTPGPRYIKEGKWSGEQFRVASFFKTIDSAIKQDKKVVVDLDGTVGYGTSFLEEIFGGLIRKHNIDYDKLVSHLEIISTEEPYLKDDVFQYLEDAEKEKLAHHN